MNKLINRELKLAAIPLAFALAIWSFFKVAKIAVADVSHKLDESILLSLRESSDYNDPVGPEWLEEMARDITALGSVAILLIMLSLAVGFVLINKNFRTALFLLLSISSGIAVSFLLKNSFDRPRPNLVAHEVQTFTSSFPSAHSMAAAVTFLTIGVLLARTQEHWRGKIYLVAAALVLTILVGVSRIYLGVHWPTDVLGGWIAGATWAFACWVIALFVLQRQTRVQNKRQRQGDG